MWKKLAVIPVVGKRLFSLAAVLTVPYFRTIRPKLETMEPGLVTVRMPTWQGVCNHIKSAHAIAACNPAEFAMSMFCETSMSTTHRWVPKGMTTSYKRIPVGGLTAVAKVELPDFSTITPETGGADFPVHIVLTDTGGTEAQDAIISCWVTAKKSEQPPCGGCLLQFLRWHTADKYHAGLTYGSKVNHRSCPKRNPSDFKHSA